MRKATTKYISLFAGALGFDLGLEWAGLEPAVCVDIDHDCCQTMARLQDAGAERADPVEVCSAGSA